LLRELNGIRLQLIENQRTAKTSHNGVLIIDDTACPDPDQGNSIPILLTFAKVIGIN